jgi:serine/threonine protein kinase
LTSRPIPFGKYLLLQRINVGGMAEVFKARLADGGTRDAIIAIKRILPSIAEAQDFIDMFIDEAKISVLLDHPNIAATYELGRTNETYYMALEYVSGRDLRSLFERKRREGSVVPPLVAAYVMSRVAEGLDYAHRKKDDQGIPLHIVHRDISPQNILLSYDGDVKLIDFGIAKAANKIMKTQSGILKGKFGYMSPEQVRGLEIDGRSDIFAAGTILHELLTGQRLFVGNSDYAVLEMVRDAVARPANEVRPDVPDELSDIAMHALQVDRDKRYQHAGELAAHLQFFLDEQKLSFSREDLAAYMRDTFHDEFDREKRENSDAVLSDEDETGPISEPAISLPQIRPALLRGESRPSLEGGLARPSADPVADIYVPSITAEQPDSLTPQRPRLMPVGPAAARSEGAADDAGAVGPGLRLTPSRAPGVVSRAAGPVDGDSAGAIPSRIRQGGASQVGLAAAAEVLPPRRKPVAPPVSRDWQKPTDTKAKISRSDEDDDEATALHANALLLPRADRTLRERAPQPASAPAHHAPAGYWPVVVFMATVAAGVLFVGALRLHANTPDAKPWQFDLSPLTPPGRASLKIKTTPPDAEILLDGLLVKPAGPSHYQSEHIEANVTHDIVARHDGYHEARQQVVLRRGESQEISLVLQPGRPLVTITTVPVGARIFIDGRDEGVAGGSVATLEPGVHTVRAEKSCFDTATKTFTVLDNVDTSLSLTLKPLNGSCLTLDTKPTDPGFLQLIAHPAAHVFIDGKDIGRDTPLLDFPLAPGHHTLRLVLEDDARVIDLDVKPGRSISQTVSFR